MPDPTKPPRIRVEASRLKKAGKIAGYLCHKGKTKQQFKGGRPKKLPIDKPDEAMNTNSKGKYVNWLLDKTVQ